MQAARRAVGPAAGLLRVVLYVVIVATPLVLVAVFRRETDDGFTFELGKSFALVAYAVLAMQFVVASRSKWIERPFGLDMVFRFHRAMAVFAVALLLLHPALLAVGGAGPGLLTSLDAPWFILIAKVALFLLVLLSLTATFRAAIRLEFEKWRIAHNFAAVAVLTAGSLHAWYSARDVRLVPMQYAWIGILALAAGTYLYHRFWAPWAARQSACEVVDVVRETHNVWTVKLARPQGKRRADHLPGQFHFFTLYRAGGLPAEEHPFTISSDPTDEGSVTYTIKESGDFTRTIGQTAAGDKAACRGPYGAFSYVLHPEESDLVFIAGGIGITPLMSMLRHMQSAGADRTVRLIYGNRTRQDIVFREELSEMAAGEHPRLRVAHVLSEPDEDWTGESGFVDRERIERLCGPELASKAFYVCGPPPMSQSVLRALRELGVPASHVHHEYFAL